MISLRGVTFAYPSSDEPALSDLDLDIADGEFLLVAGASGSGKSTLLRVPPALVPHHSGGTFSGLVEVAGRDVTGLPARELAGVVGFVPQDPEAHATSDRVLPELAFAMENLGVAPTMMRKRIEEVLDQLGIAHLRNRRLDELSGGERQRVAIAAVLTAQPKVLVCDEPTSALDPQSVEDVFAVLGRLRDELGLTIVCSEHRLERVVTFADRVCFLNSEATVGEPRAVFDGASFAPVRKPGLRVGEPRAVFDGASFAPPVTILGRRMGWEPLPLTVREGRAFAAGLDVQPPIVARPPSGPVVLSAERLSASVGGNEILRKVDLSLHRGEVTALVGRNGSGKTTLLRVLSGLLEPTSGSVSREGTVAFVPQRAEMLLFRDRVRDELAAAHNESSLETWLDRLRLSGVADRHPWTLSAGQRLWLALGTTFVRDLDVYLLDEPTRGLDPPGKDRLAAILRAKADQGAAILLVTHDVELIARSCDKVHMLAEGEIVASGPVREVLGESLLFSSQTQKVMDDPRFLVPGDVVAGLS